MNYYLNVLKNYATFSGRARRSEYWYFILFNSIIAFAIGFVSGLLRINMLSIIYTLFILIPSIAVAVRRMHDVGKSGWFLLIPIYNFVLACTEGIPSSPSSLINVEKPNPVLTARSLPLQPKSARAARICSLVIKVILIYY
jgi:uncharacterized membrane protein YhaH (DUF805 family)